MIETVHGLFAIANMVEICFSSNPEDLSYDQDVMRNHVQRNEAISQKFKARLKYFHDQRGVALEYNCTVFAKYLRIMMTVRYAMKHVIRGTTIDPIFMY